MGPRTVLGSLTPMGVSICPVAELTETSQSNEPSEAIFIDAHFCIWGKKIWSFQGFFPTSIGMDVKNLLF